jgi:haloalkane dehalogenase
MNCTIDKTAFRDQFPFESRFLNANGLQYHYIDTGAGEAVVMLHGNPTWSFYYRNLIRRLAPRYRVVAPDHIGCGLSEKPPPENYGYRLENRIEDLGRLFEHLGLNNNVTLIVHDWGGMIGLAYAVMHPERFSRLVLLNTAAFRPLRNKPLPLSLRLIRNFPLLASPAVLRGNLFARGAARMASFKGLKKSVRRGLTAPYNCPRNRTATLKFVQDIPLSPRDPSYAIVARTDERLHTLARLPVLICWGGRDFVFDDDYLAEWRRRFPRALVRRIPDAGHYVLEDACGEVLDAVEHFLEHHPGSEAPALFRKHQV